MSSIKLSDLQPDKGNANKGTQRGLRALDTSLRKYGAGRSILVDKNGVVIAGNKTLERAADIGLDDVIVVETDGTKLVAVKRTDLDLEDDGGKARALATYDNRAGQLDLDWDVDALKNVDTDVLKDLWTVDELDELGVIEKLMGDAEPQIDRAAELQEKWQVKTGDLWRIGDHRLFSGDCTVSANVERLMQGERAGAVVTDPPYGINREGIENDDPEGLRALFDGCLACMPIDNAVVIAFQSPRLFPVWLDAVREAGHQFERMLWMYKRNDVTNVWRGWLLTSEAILLSSFGKAEWEKEKEASHDCYMLNWEEKTFGKVDGWHASIKPLEVVKNIITHTVGTIYEPFLGSGTTIVACQNLGRKCRAIEISPEYCAVTLERMATAFPGIEIEKLD